MTTTTVMVVEMLPRYPCSIKSTKHRNSSLLLQCDFKSISRSLSHSLSEVVTSLPFHRGEN